jgi:hypothetical protein
MIPECGESRKGFSARLFHSDRLEAAVHEKDQGQQAERDDGEELIIIAESQHFRLAQYFLIEPGHGIGAIPPLPVGPQIRQGLRQAMLPVGKGLG